MSKFLDAISTQLKSSKSLLEIPVSNDEQDDLLEVVIPDGITESYDFDNYRMFPRNKKVAYIFNLLNFKARGSLTASMQPRLGSKEDVKRLKSCFKDRLKFDVKAFENASRRKIFDEVKKLAEDDHSGTDCIVVVIMTHGGEKGVLEAYDEEFKMKEVLNLFKNNDNPTLVGKPKLFFVQACRGDKLDKGQNFKCFDAKGNVREELLIPTGVDQLVMYATMEGSVALRSQKTGSWLIQELCNQLENNLVDDLLSMLTVTIRKVAIKEGIVLDHKTGNKITVKQGAVIVSSLTKKIFLNASISQTEKSSMEADNATDATDSADSFLSRPVINGWQLITITGLFAIVLIAICAFFLLK